MPEGGHALTAASRVLVKLRPTAALRAAESRAGLRPLHDRPATAFELGAEPGWFVADVPEVAASPWDLAHERVAEQLGVAESDVLFVEPDLVHDIYPSGRDDQPEGAFEIGTDCSPRRQKAQNGRGGQAKGPGRFAWHLEDDYSQLASARSDVDFTEPHTRIAHLDTGYSSRHVTAPVNVLKNLERNFVARDGVPYSAEDPDNKAFPIDNSGHGTGTLGILAGAIPSGYSTEPLGGAPEADIVPLRIADTVVLLYTSAFARALRHAVDVRCDVVTMSMGGLPSRAWREEIERAYDAGVCIVSAAGNNFANLPTRNIVYPARYGCVISACGVMADGRPYHGLTPTTMQGNFGPKSVMGTALGAYTPNIAWPVFGCEEMIRLDGSGTSAATPQIAAAAALWFERYKAALPRDWRRVEAVMHALFSSAGSPGAYRDQLGNGVLRAAAALRVRPRLGLPRRKIGGDSFAFLRVLTGLGILEVPAREEMFNLELLQRWLVTPALQELVPDPEATETLEEDALRRVMEVLIEDPGTSRTLKKHLETRYPVIAGASPPRPAETPTVPPACEQPPEVVPPSHRRLHVYAVDPDLSGRLDTASINEITLDVRWEDLDIELGGGKLVGEYLEIDDLDPSGERYSAVDLDDPHLLAQDGWAPSEGNPHFHQQMVYAVVMKTIERFEHALGRPLLWRARPNTKDTHDDSSFVRRIAVHPHAVRQANAFYSPSEVALRFGYFEARPGDPGELVPGSRVYTCLSHDVIAHETTHAVLDGMFRRFAEPSNPDVLAFHEALADLVALLQRFTIPTVLEAEIRRTRGDFEAGSLLGGLALQLGRATGGRAALRDAIGAMRDGTWVRHEPDPSEIDRRQTPHSRGAILVAAVFDAFIAIYKSRTADLLRIYTGGTGVLPSGELHPDLVRRLAREAAASAAHVLTMCIRALDYLPPLDVTFFEYLRALITADFDIVRDDRHNYRVAFVESFRRWGIHPAELDQQEAEAPRTLSVDTLRWRGIDIGRASKKERAAIESAASDILAELREYADLCFYLEDREELFHTTRERRRSLHRRLTAAFRDSPGFAEMLGLDPQQRFEVHELRRAMRVAPSGRHIPQVIVALTQSARIRADEAVPAHDFRGGTTLVVDLAHEEIKYAVFKRVGSENRRARTRAFRRQVNADPLRALLSPERQEPFAALHAVADHVL